MTAGRGRLMLVLFALLLPAGPAGAQVVTAGSERADTIFGSALGDVLAGSFNDDRISGFGGPGDDYLDGNRGDDGMVLGGDGEDRLTLQTSSDAEIHGCQTVVRPTRVDLPTEPLLFGSANGGFTTGGPTAGTSGSLAELLQNVLRGGPFRDHIIGTDLATEVLPSADVIDCGTGRDKAYVDSTDRVRNCEVLARSRMRVLRHR